MPRTPITKRPKRSPIHTAFILLGVTLIYGSCPGFILWIYCYNYFYTPAIHVAAAAGDISKIQELLQEGADVNMPSPVGTGETPLHYAASAGQPKAAEALIAAGAKVDQQDKFGDTPLHCLSSFGGKAYPIKTRADRAAVARVLLDHGANPNIRNDSGNTPLMDAVHDENAETVRLLLEHGASVTIPDSQGNTAITIATAMDSRAPNADPEVLKLVRAASSIK